MEKIYNFILTKEESDHAYYKKKVSQTNIHRAHNMKVQIAILKVKDHEAVWMPAISCHPYVWQSHSLWRGNRVPQCVVGFLKFFALEKLWLPNLSHQPNDQQNLPGGHTCGVACEGRQPNSHS
jgi:hypothetical protein